MGGRRCVIKCCRNRPDFEKGIALHKFPFFGDERPEAKKRLLRWIDFLKTYQPEWPIERAKVDVICSLHFTSLDFKMMFSYLLGVDEVFRPRLATDDLGVTAYPKYYRVPTSNNNSTETNNDNMPNSTPDKGSGTPESYPMTTQKSCRTALVGNKKQLVEKKRNKKRKADGNNLTKGEPKSKTKKTKDESISKIKKTKDKPISKSKKTNDERISKTKKTKDERISKTKKKKDERISKTKKTKDERISKTNKTKDERISKTKKRKDERISKTKKTKDGPIFKTRKTSVRNGTVEGIHNVASTSVVSDSPQLKIDWENDLCSQLGAQDNAVTNIDEQQMNRKCEQTLMSLGCIVQEIKQENLEGENRAELDKLYEQERKKKGKPEKFTFENVEKDQERKRDKEEMDRKQLEEKEYDEILTKWQLEKVEIEGELEGSQRRKEKETIEKTRREQLEGKILELEQLIEIEKNAQESSNLYVKTCEKCVEKEVKLQKEIPQDIEKPASLFQTGVLRGLDHHFQGSTCLASAENACKASIYECEVFLSYRKATCEATKDSGVGGNVARRVLQKLVGLEINSGDDENSNDKLQLRIKQLEEALIQEKEKTQKSMKVKLVHDQFLIDKISITNKKITEYVNLREKRIKEILDKKQIHVINAKFEELCSEKERSEEANIRLVEQTASETQNLLMSGDPKLKAYITVDELQEIGRTYHSGSCLENTAAYKDIGLCNAGTLIITRATQTTPLPEAAGAICDELEVEFGRQGNPCSVESTSSVGVQTEAVIKLLRPKDIQSVCVQTDMEESLEFEPEILHSSSNDHEDLTNDGVSGTCTMDGNAKGTQTCKELTEMSEVWKTNNELPRTQMEIKSLKKSVRTLKAELSKWKLELCVKKRQYEEAEKSSKEFESLVKECEEKEEQRRLDRKQKKEEREQMNRGKMRKKQVKERKRVLREKRRLESLTKKKS